jgi:hypothetical protein
MLENKSSKKLHEDIKVNSNNSTIKGENFMKNDFRRMFSKKIF